MSAAVGGVVEPGFEAVKEILSAAPDLGNGGAAFCAIHEGKVVADVWVGNKSPGEPWERDTTSATYSSIKGATALSALVLFDRGALELDVPVSKYWDGFQADVTVRQVLGHSAGLITIPDYADFIGPIGFVRSDLPEVRKRLARAVPVWEPGSRHGYHGITYGYLVGTLVELISGQPLGEFFEKEIAGPNQLDVSHGYRPGEEGRFATLQEPLPFADPQMQRVADAMLAPARDPEDFAGMAFLATPEYGSLLDNLAGLANQPECLNNGGGYGDGVATARGLAQMYELARRIWIGETAIKPESIKTFATVQSSGLDAILRVPSNQALGFGVNAELMPGVWTMGPSKSSFGHGGAGGQAAFLDPELGVAIGFVRSQLSVLSTLGRELALAVFAGLGH